MSHANSLETVFLQSARFSALCKVHEFSKAYQVIFEIRLFNFRSSQQGFVQSYRRLSLNNQFINRRYNKALLSLRRGCLWTNSPYMFLILDYCDAGRKAKDCP
jgi:hypothetical protein